jgi:hypothetical protein
MKKNESDTVKTLLQIVTENGSETEGYPLYPENEDIYNKFRKEKSIDPDDITKLKEKGIVGKGDEKDFEDDVTGSDLDIPGTEVDDSEELVVIEDEENSYFSLGGDDHMDLEENL